MTGNVDNLSFLSYYFRIYLSILILKAFGSHLGNFKMTAHSFKFATYMMTKLFESI